MSKFDVIVVGSRSLGRGELVRQIGLLWRVEAMNADSFVAGHRLLVKGGLVEAEANKIAGKLRALGAEVEVAPSAIFSMPANVSLVSLDDDNQPPPVIAAPATAAHSPPVEDARFSGPQVSDLLMQLDRPPSPEKAVEPAPPPLPLPPNPDEVDAPFEPIPGRLFRGALRQQPVARIAAGIVLALLIGWVAATPTARRAERRVADLRAQANVDRYRPTDEARANASRLEEQADDIATGAFVKVVLLWLVVGAAGFGVWYRFT